MTGARLAAVALLVTVVACAGTALKQRSRSARDLAATAKENGAMRCAPVELAMAESHLDFADQELSEGRYYAARSELEIAEANAQLALRKSPKEKCAPKVEQVVKLEVTPQDSDGDGILDPDDECPNDPEDKDGFQDDDGCPEPDNDGDGVPECPEAIDQCPDEAAQTPDGCPQKYKLVVVTKTKIELKQTIYFETAKATIKPVSYPLLDEVAEALADHPKIAVRIEGHTDSRGSNKFNLKLSDDRAKSVRDYLIGKGIDAGRMDARGYGEDVPIADNRSDAGRAQNRRVEFVITSQ